MKWEERIYVLPNDGEHGHIWIRIRLPEVKIKSGIPYVFIFLRPPPHLSPRKFFCSYKSRSCSLDALFTSLSLHPFVWVSGKSCYVNPCFHITCWILCGWHFLKWWSKKIWHKMLWFCPIFIWSFLFCSTFTFPSVCCFYISLSCWSYLNRIGLVGRLDLDSGHPESARAVASKKGSRSRLEPRWRAGRDDQGILPPKKKGCGGKPELDAFIWYGEPHRCGYEKGRFFGFFLANAGSKWFQCLLTDFPKMTP